MEEKYFRNKITWFNFICCILVIWNHSGNADLFFPGIGAEDPLMRFQYLIIPELTRIMIPCFIMLSGYLFYRNFTMDQLPRKWKRRVQTLLIPYFLWNGLYYLGYLIAGQIDGIAAIVNRPGLEFTASNLFNAVVRYAFNPVFWFMYQLILLVALAPVLYLLLRNAWVGLGFMALLAWGVYRHTALPELNLDALFYYSVAAYGALHGKEMAERPWSGKRALFGAGLLAAGMYIARGYYTHYFVLGIVLYQAAAPIAFWLMVDEKRLGKVRALMNDTFFIYAFHFIPVRFINKTAALLWPGEKWAAILAFVLMPVLAGAVCFGAASLLRRFTPGLWSLLNGGR